MQKDLFGIILAGGSGSRLWPLSRELYPKQFLSFSEEKTLLQLTYQRLQKFTEPQNIVTVANNRHVSGIRFQLGKLEDYTKHCVIGEPLAKNTAPAIALGICSIKKLAGKEDPVVIVAPSDHLIKNKIKFTEAVLEGAETAKQGYIVTFGIKPSAPETGYGYIKILPDQKIGKTGLKTDCFKEKPNHSTAEEYIKSGKYFWNSGIFMFKLSTIIEEFENKAPEIISRLKNTNLEDSCSCREVYEKFPSISIDYAIMEKSDRIVLIPAEFDWNDLGSWEAIYSVSAKNQNNNVIKGDVQDIKCKDSLLYSSSRHVAAIGLKDTVIVETADAVLVCSRNDSQEVKKAFESLKKEDSELCTTHKTMIEDWGSATSLEKKDNMEINRIVIRQNKKMEIDSPDKRIKHYYVSQGTAILKVENGVKLLNIGQSLDIKDEPVHAIENSGSEDLEIIEITRF